MLSSASILVKATDKHWIGDAPNAGKCYTSRMPRHALVAAVALLWLAALPSTGGAQPSSRPSTDDPSQPHLGQFHLTFTEQSPLSPIEAQSKRYHIKIEPIHRYALAAESFEAFVPED